MFLQFSALLLSFDFSDQRDRRSLENALQAAHGRTALTENALCSFARLLQDSRKAEARKHVSIDLQVLAFDLI